MAHQGHEYAAVFQWEYPIIYKFNQGTWTKYDPLVYMDSTHCEYQKKEFNHISNTLVPRDMNTMNPRPKLMNATAFNTYSSQNFPFKPGHTKRQKK